MKKSKSKYLTLAGLVLGTGVLLSACGNSSTASKTYNYVYSSDPSTPIIHPKSKNHPESLP
ncbi:hypothetical protein RLE67_00255 [Streptococcus pneumoniae]|nr:hypothetical protein [Streptococcus pneumoniae]MDS6106149.1 hypothetical protein [Streptococcus pneumoniae]